MKTHFFIKKHMIHPLYILLIFSIVSCIDRSSSSEEDTKDSESVGENMPKAISEVIFVDNGAVMTKPSTRRIKWTLKNAENILLSYTEQNGDDKNGTHSDITVNDDTRDAVRDEIERIAEFAEDGLAIKPGKQPCAGMNSLQVSVVYNTGDTSRIAISGSVRCDPSLYPSVWALDSMATDIYRAHKNK